MGTPVMLAVLDDLMFQSRLEQHAIALGYSFVAADSDAEVRSALERDAAIAVIDLHVRGIAWRDAAALAREAAVPVIAFGRHTEAQLLREARDAGCDRVVARSQLVEELPALVGSVLDRA